MLDVDYLVVGGGAMGMAFADALVAETDATLAIVDGYGNPGGHWTRAYPFVRLHQPSAYYGVNSRELGSGAKDTEGWNAGLYELAGCRGRRLLRPGHAPAAPTVGTRSVLPHARIHGWRGDPIARLGRSIRDRGGEDRRRYLFEGGRPVGPHSRLRRGGWSVVRDRRTT